jgi:hypothetical protein
MSDKSAEALNVGREEEKEGMKASDLAYGHLVLYSFSCRRLYSPIGGHGTCLPVCHPYDVLH